jgi:hypothetical protein
VIRSDEHFGRISERPVIGEYGGVHVPVHADQRQAGGDGIDLAGEVAGGMVGWQRPVRVQCQPPHGLLLPILGHAVAILKSVAEHCQERGY